MAEIIHTSRITITRESAGKPGRTCATYCFYAFIFKNNARQKTLGHAF